MRNLWFFFIRYYPFLLFLLLESLCVSILYSFHNVHRSRLIEWSFAVSGNMNQRISNLNNYWNLREVNQKLLMENSILRDRLRSSYRYLEAQPDTLTDTAGRVAWNYTEAWVVSNSVSKRNNFLVINKGSNHGLQKNMGVIGPDGVVGIVTQVSPNFSTVQSLLHKDSRISAKLSRTQAFGTLRWEGLSSTTALLDDIPGHIQIRTGDVLVTSGYSTIFPPGLPLGQVSTKPEEGDLENFQKVAIRLSTDFSTLRYIYVITSFEKEEKSLHLDVQQ